MLPVIFLIDKILEIYVWILIASIGILQGHNPTVRMVGEFLYRITDPVLRPIRNFLPYLGPIDISPMVVILLIWFIRMELVQLAGYL
jgi:YggT family protein